MFSLKQELAQWSKQLKTKTAMDAGDIAELQDHLLTQFEVMKEAGMSEREAFDLAVQKTGSLNEISREYEKNDAIGQLLTVIATAPWLTKLLGLLLVTGSALHVYYAVRFFRAVPESLTIITSLIFLIMLWSLIKGMLILAGKEGGHIGLLLFFLCQIPVLYLANNNYDVATGLAINLYFGDIDSRLVFAPGSDLHINLGSASERQYVGINLFAAGVSLLMGIKLWHRNLQENPD